MKTTGITRRIDDLGRIVIPKEIRKNMHIKSGEMFEIFLEIPDVIVLKKYSVIKENEIVINYFVKNISKLIKGEVYLVSLDSVVFSTDKKILGKNLSRSFENLISTGRFNFNSIKELEIVDDYFITGEIDAYPLLPHGDLSGFLIFKYNEIPTEKIRELVKFSIDFIKDYMEES